MEEKKAELYVHVDPWVTDGMAGGSLEGSQLEGEGRGGLVKRHMNKPMGMGTERADLPGSSCSAGVMP